MTSPQPRVRRASSAFTVCALFVACGGSAVQEPNGANQSPSSSAGNPSAGTAQNAGTGGSNYSPPTKVGVPNGGSGGVGGVPEGSTEPPLSGCNAGSIHFKLLAQPGSSTLYCVGDQNSCMPNWLSIHAAGGVDLPLDPDRCKGSCSTCSAFGCTALCLEPTQLGTSGIEAVFTGSYAPSGTCGAGMACNDSACIPPGQYVAKLCGYRASIAGPVLAPTQQCDYSRDNPACVALPFTWPPSASMNGATLTGTIGDFAEDAGAGAPGQ